MGKSSHNTTTGVRLKTEADVLKEPPRPKQTIIADSAAIARAEKDYEKCKAKAKNRFGKRDFEGLTTKTLRNMNKLREEGIKCTLKLTKDLQSAP